MKHSRQSDDVVPYERDLERPAPVVDTKAKQWCLERPATTVQGDLRIWPPGHKINSDDRRRLGDAAAAERYGDRAGSDAIRVELHELAALQDFPDGFPFQGNKTQRARQIGNAVPSTLAEVIARALNDRNSE